MIRLDYSVIDDETDIARRNACPLAREVATWKAMADSDFKVYAFFYQTFHILMIAIKNKLASSVDAIAISEI